MSATAGMGLTRHLIWRLRLGLRTWRGRGGTRRRLTTLGGVALAFSLFLVSRSLFMELARYPQTSLLAPLIVAGVLHAVFFFSLLRDTSGAMGHLFLSADTAFLLAAPTGSRRLLTLRCLEALADAMTAPASTAVPILLGYGAASGAGAGYFLAVPLAITGLIALTVGAGILLALALAPLSPPGGIRHFLSAVSALFFLIAWLAVVWFARNADPGVVQDLGAAGAGLASGSLSAWLPASWVAADLMSMAAGGHVSGSGFLRLGAAALVILTALLALAPSYATAWQASQASHRRRYRHPQQNVQLEPAHTGNVKRLPMVERRYGFALLVRGFFLRDRRLLFREPGMMTDLGVLVVMTAFLPLILAPAMDGTIGSTTVLLLSVMVFVAVEFGYELGSRALPLERRSLHWTLTSPCSTRMLLLSRLAASWWVGLPWIAVVALVGCLGLGIGFHGLMLATILGAALLALSLPVGYVAGVYLGRSDWRHPRQMLTMGGRLLFLALLLVLALGYWVIFRLSNDRQTVFDTMGWGSPAGWGLALAGVIGVVGFCVWLSGRRLRSLEWPY